MSPSKAVRAPCLSGVWRADTQSRKLWSRLIWWEKGQKRQKTWRKLFGFMIFPHKSSCCSGELPQALRRLALRTGPFGQTVMCTLQRCAVCPTTYSLVDEKLTVLFTISGRWQLPRLQLAFKWLANKWLCQELIWSHLIPGMFCSGF